MAQANKTITTVEFGSKFRSKHEVYYFLDVTVGAYLPPKETCTIYFLKDIIRGIKHCKSN